jgi:uncharacterized repeat protein (TIGR03803 family)
MKPLRAAILLTTSVAVWMAATEASTAADLVSFEAESGTLGTNFLVGNSSGVIYISNTNNNTTSIPGIPGRVASYNVTFPAAGTYDLYARIRTGPVAGGDDSFLYGNGFGVKSPTTTTDWILCNNLGTVGFVNSGDIVTGGGSAGSGVWKWIDVSQFNGGQAPINFTVPSGNLTQTFQIGGREDGFDIDKFAFGTTGTSFAVSNLDNGTVPPPPPPLTNVFVGPDGIAFHRFSPLNNGINADGANPAAGLVFSSGVICGTTLNGGLQGAGTAFFMTLDGRNLTAFRSFIDAPDAGNPQGDLAVSGNRIFGTTFGGGNSGVGSVFVGQTNGDVSLLRSFAAVNAHTATNSGGASPTALIALFGNTLYGTTTIGGIAANGTIFSLTTNGSMLFVLHDFGLLDSQTGTNVDGAVPWGGLILFGDTLYGTASAGGAGGNGVVFSVNTNGGSFTTLHSFTPMDTLTATNADGAVPFGGLVLSSNTLYGTTSAGGQGGRGTVFSMQTSGLGFVVLHDFSATDPVTGTNMDGAAPCAALSLSGSVLYGTAAAGGTGGNGTVYSVRTDGTRFTTLYSFAALDPLTGTNAYGAMPVAGLLLLGNSLYGTTFSGGPGAAGTVFSLPIPSSPAVIINVVRNPDGSVTFFFLGGPNSTNIIQTTASLAPPVIWQNVSTNVADAGGAWQFTEGNATNITRFFRSYAP